MISLWKLFSVRTFLCLISLSTALLGCSSIKKLLGKEDQATLSANTNQENPQGSAVDDAYADGLQFLNERKFEKAIDTFEKFLKENTASRYFMAATFHLGRAYEDMMVWSKAMENYRKVAVAPSAGRELQARSLYRLSFCYEAIGDNTKSVASLIDALRRKRYLPFEVAEAEAPARLAAAYARIGNEKEAMKYYVEAEKGIKQLRRANPQETPEWMPKTLFYMGTISDLTIDSTEFEAEIRPLKRAQFYLLQAAELEDKVWSEQSADRLKAIYEALWMAVEGVALPSENEDPLLAQRERQQQQWQMAHKILQAIEDLRINRLPVEHESSYVSRIFGFLNGYEKNIQDFLRQPPVGQGKTPEAQMREGLRRRGTTRGDETVLEKEQSSPSLPKKNIEKELGDDPNL